MIDLEAQPAARAQRAIARLEERREVLGADRLEHLDRDDGVVRALDVAVVAQLDVDEVVEAGLADARAGELVLLLRDRDRRHPAAQLARRVQREPAPARADLQDVLAGAQPGVRPRCRRYLFRCASASDWSGVSKTALEYVIVSSRNSR